VDGDRTRTDDDHCIQITWASSFNGAALVLDTPQTVRAFTCGNTSKVLSGVRYSYDGLPEGSVGIGLPSGRILERHDLSTGTLLEQIQSATAERDVFGNLVRMVRSRPDGATATTAIEYDPFGLAPVHTENVATGLAQTLVSKATRDANSLLPLTVTDQNGAAVYNTFDKFGRMTRQSVIRASMAAPTEANAGNADPATVGVYTEVIDELGRRMHGIVDLGTDYNRQSLIVDSTAYDLLGRPSFIADPFPATAFVRYGTTFTYRADSRPECLIQGAGRQTIPTTDETVDRFTSCNSYIYDDNQLAIRTSGPNELTTGKAQSGAFDEVNWCYRGHRDRGDRPGSEGFWIGS
jgi:hypothetical protein